MKPVHKIAYFIVPVLALAVGGAIATAEVGADKFDGEAVPVEFRQYYDPVKGGSKSLNYTLKALGARYEATDSNYVERNLRDLLPNHEFVIGDEDPAPLVLDTVIGTVVSIDPGAGYRVFEEDAAAGVPVRFDDPDALWKVIEVTIRVEESFGDTLAGEDIRVGLAFGTGLDEQSLLSGLKGERVLVPVEDARFFSHDRSLYSVRQGGALLGVVEAGRLRFPAMGDDEKSFVNGDDTVGEVREAADQTVRPVEVDDEALVPLD